MFSFPTIRHIPKEEGIKQAKNPSSQLWTNWWINNLSDERWRASTVTARMCNSLLWVSKSCWNSPIYFCAWSLLVSSMSVSEYSIQLFYQQCFLRKQNTDLKSRWKREFWSRRKKYTAKHDLWQCPKHRKQQKGVVEAAVEEIVQTCYTRFGTQFV